MDGDNSAPAQPAGQRPTWRIRAIVSGAAAAAVVAVAYGIVNASNRTDPLDKVAGAQPTGAAAVALLRSQLPPDLRSAKECEPATPPETNALATIVCVWAKSHVPNTATYSLFADDAAMLAAAESLRGRSGRRGPGRGGGLGAQGTSCDSAADFDNGGGKTTWQSDNRERGTMWCYRNDDGQPALICTDTDTAILTSAVAQDQADQLLGWFREEGQPEPLPTPPGGSRSPSKSPSPSPSPSKSTSPSPEPSVPYPDRPSDGPTDGPTGGPTGGPEPTEPGPNPT